MKFTFKALKTAESDSAYLMDFGTMKTAEDAALTEGRLRAVFGAPAYESENYEDSFCYEIEATADNGKSVVLLVYGAGFVHIGTAQKSFFARRAAKALINHVNAAAPIDYERTLYSLEHGVRADVSVKNGVATVTESALSDEKAEALEKEWYE